MGSVADEKATRLVMDDAIRTADADSYVRRIGDETLRAVCGQGHRWLGWGDVNDW